MRIIEYLRNPFITNEYCKISFKRFFKIFVLSYFFMLAINGIPRILEVLKIIPHNEISDILSKYHPLVIFLLLVIAGPFAEEAIFRLNLKKSKTNFVFSISVVLGYIILSVCLGSKNYTHIAILLILFAVMLILFYANTISNNTQKYFKYIFYFSAIAFGFMHIFNYSGLTMITFVLFPLITLPQIVLGLISGYLRMYHGFVYGVLFHSLVNLLAFLALFLTKDII